jgi:hypothetical protein
MGYDMHALSVVIQALEFEPVGPQNQWVDVMFLTVRATEKHCSLTGEILYICPAEDLTHNMPLTKAQ